MSPSKTKNYAASVRQRLLNYARTSGQDFIFVLRTFAMERLLYRLSRSPYADNFVLKGAMLFKLWTGDFYRQTRDIDVLSFKSQTTDSLKAIFQDISQIPFIDDGLTYLSDTVNVNEIREGQQYGGLRVTLTAMLGSAKIHLQVDCGFGDAITPDPVVTDFPTLLDFPAPQLHTYPKETVVAEKFDQLPFDWLSHSNVTNDSTQEQKIALFRSLIRGREDVYPRRFESKRIGESGFQPVCRNEWIRPICQKPKIKNLIVMKGGMGKKQRQAALNALESLPDDTEKAVSLLPAGT